MRSFLLGLSIVAATPLAIVACSSSSSSSSTATGTDGGGNGDGGGTNDGGGLGDGGTGGGVKSDIPGDPPSAGTGSAIEVTINGQARVFDGPATWTKFPREGGTIVGFQTNARSASEWTLVLAVFGNTPGTYDCSAAAGEDRGGGLSISNAFLADGGLNPDEIRYGGTVTSEQCSITLETYGDKQGDHVTGTFTGELDLSQGDTKVTHLSLTNGKFDLVQFSDVPP